jgi:hypothetical protein
MGSGIGEESMIATKNSPNTPRCVIQCGISEGFTRDPRERAVCKKEILMLIAL